MSFKEIKGVRAGRATKEATKDRENSSKFQTILSQHRNIKEAARTLKARNSIMSLACLPPINL
jgi:capsid protein